VQGYRHAFVE